MDNKPGDKGKNNQLRTYTSFALIRSENNLSLKIEKNLNILYNKGGDKQK